MIKFRRVDTEKREESNRRESLMNKRVHYRLGLISAAALIAGSLLLPGAFPAGRRRELSAVETALERREAAVLVHVAAAGLRGQCEKTADVPGKIALIRDFIGPVRFFPDGSGYFYVYDYDCVCIAHAVQKDLVGKDLSEHRDAKGMFVIRELAKAARTGGGFVEYYWVKPGATGEQKKIGYVEPIPGTNFFIGTGVYQSPAE